MSRSPLYLKILELCRGLRTSCVAVLQRVGSDEYQPALQEAVSQIGNFVSFAQSISTQPDLKLLYQHIINIRALARDFFEKTNHLHKTNDTAAAKIHQTQLFQPVTTAITAIESHARVLNMVEPKQPTQGTEAAPPNSSYLPNPKLAHFNQIPCAFNSTSYGQSAVYSTPYDAPIEPQPSFASPYWQESQSPTNPTFHSPVSDTLASPARSFYVPNQTTGEDGSTQLSFTPPATPHDWSGPQASSFVTVRSPLLSASPFQREQPRDLQPSPREQPTRDSQLSRDLQQSLSREPREHPFLRELQPSPREKATTPRDPFSRVPVLSSSPGASSTEHPKTPTIPPILGLTSSHSPPAFQSSASPRENSWVLPSPEFRSPPVSPRQGNTSRSQVATIERSKDCTPNRQREVSPLDNVTRPNLLYLDTPTAPPTKPQPSALLKDSNPETEPHPRSEKTSLEQEPSKRGPLRKFPPSAEPKPDWNTKFNKNDTTRRDFPPQIAANTATDITPALATQRNPGLRPKKNAENSFYRPRFTIQFNQTEKLLLDDSDYPDAETEDTQDDHPPDSESSDYDENFVNDDDSYYKNRYTLHITKEQLSESLLKQQNDTDIIFFPSDDSFETPRTMERIAGRPANPFRTYDPSTPTEDASKTTLELPQRISKPLPTLTSEADDTTEIGHNIDASLTEEGFRDPRDIAFVKEYTQLCQTTFPSDWDALSRSSARSYELLVHGALQKYKTATLLKNREAISKASQLQATEQQQTQPILKSSDTRRALAKVKGRKKGI